MILIESQKRWSLTLLKFLFVIFARIFVLWTIFFIYLYLYFILFTWMCSETLFITVVIHRSSKRVVYICFQINVCYLIRDSNQRSFVSPKIFKLWTQNSLYFKQSLYFNTRYPLNLFKVRRIFVYPHSDRYIARSSLLMVFKYRGYTIGFFFSADVALPAIVLLMPVNAFYFL